MSFMLALPKISLHGAGAIGDMVKLVAGKQWGKALRGNGFPKINIKENYHEFYVGTT
ncbi:hypothetical protein L7H87_00330 [Klebsiella pneumoniae]|nr:hypothetical protein L7H87_00330 [Klebsiella pneumoniae]